MAREKKWRSDNTYLITSKSEGNPRLGAKLLKDGRESLFLDYYKGYFKDANGKMKVEKEREYLKAYLIGNPKNPIERANNKEILERAKARRNKEYGELVESETGFKSKKDRDINFLVYFEDYYKRYTKKDKAAIKSAMWQFKDFLRDKNYPEYNRYKDRIKPGQITKDMVGDFTDYIKSRSKTSIGAASIYARFKKVVKYATEHDIFTKDPCKGVSIKADTQKLEKEVLSIDEVKRVIGTPYTGNPEVKRAIIFCFSTGIRFCDTKKLKFSNVDYANKRLSFEQSKTGGWAPIPLNKSALEIIGTPTEGGRDSLIFNLPTYQTCNNYLKRWVKEAGIDKKITWHCTRHSFATNLLLSKDKDGNSFDIKTVSSLLGHSSIVMTEKYSRAVDGRKRAAVDSLPDLF